MRPSITKQTDARFIEHGLLKPSPRNYNPGLCSFNGRVWMAYRSHRMDQEGRCGVVICELVNGEPKQSQWINLGGATGREHHEDPRLFVFTGKLHVAYSETSFPPGRPYIAVQKYARLENSSKGWKVAEVYRPRYGNNHADLMEKNWQFFEQGGRLHAIYCAEPAHIVIQLDGDKVVREFKTPALRWPFGEIRGGTPPIRAEFIMGGAWITFFHSSTPAQEGNWRRYWMGAYLMDENFGVTEITARPIAGGSENDDHGNDPRTRSSWKPYVVFPGGAVQYRDANGGYGHEVAVGINDWRIALVKVPFRGEDYCTPGANMSCRRYFWTPNGQRPLTLMQQDRTPFWVEWSRRPSPIGAAEGVTIIEDPWLAEEILHMPKVREITAEDYKRLAPPAMAARF
jgi:predicted GH43/DUF377 family glycosyl hydrolase